MATSELTDQQHELQQFVTSLIDSLDLRPAEIIDLRMEPRPVRTIPVLVIPCEDGEPDVARTMFVVTRNLSSTGAALISQSAIRTQEVVLGMWNNQECRFATAVVRYQVPIEGGFSQIGVELLRLIRIQDFPSLQQLSELAARLTSDST